VKNSDFVEVMIIDKEGDRPINPKIADQHRENTHAGCD
jgi:hypothetical protein